MVVRAMLAPPQSPVRRSHSRGAVAARRRPSPARAPAGRAPRPAVRRDTSRTSRRSACRRDRVPGLSGRGRAAARARRGHRATRGRHDPKQRERLTRAGRLLRRLLATIYGRLELRGLCRRSSARTFRRADRSATSSARRVHRRLLDRERHAGARRSRHTGAHRECAGHGRSRVRRPDGRPGGKNRLSVVR